MTAAAPPSPSALELAAVGPVQATVTGRVADGAGINVVASVAERSPLGPRALRVVPTETSIGAAPSTSQVLARWLSAQPWVDGVSVRPRHVYVRVGTDALVSWVTAGLGPERRAGGKHGDRRRRALVRLAADASPIRMLDQFRARAVAGVLAAVLEWGGFTIVGSDDGIDGAPLAVLVGGDSATPGWRWAGVGAVDVRQGSLSARHGGTVVPADLVDDAAAWTVAGARGSRATGGGAMPSRREAEAAVAFTLLRTGRGRRLQLDDARLRADVAAFTAIVDVRRAADALVDASGRPWASGRSAAADRALRDLALELEMTPSTVARATADLDPAAVIRFVRSLANRMQAAAPHLPGGDPLWGVARSVLDTGLGVLDAAVASGLSGGDALLGTEASGMGGSRQIEKEGDR